MNKVATSTLAGHAGASALPARRPVPAPPAPQPGFRVLQTGRAPAQLSLCLRPGIALR